MFKKLLNSSYKNSINKFTLLYVLFGFFWIILSDKIIIALGWDDSIHQTLKGIFYVSLTGILLYSLLKKNANEYLQIINELDNTKSNLDSILNSLDDVIWSIKLDFSEFIYLSETCERVYGYRQEEFLQKPTLWMDIVYEADKDIVKLNIEKVFTEGTYTATHRAYNKQNQIIWVQNKIWLVRDVKGELVRIDGITTNITKQINDEIRIKELYEDYKFLFENNPSPVILVNIDNLDIERYNKSANSIFHLNPNSNIEKTNFTNFKNILADYSQINLISKLHDNKITYIDYGIWNFKNNTGNQIKGHVFAYNLLDYQTNRNNNYKIVVINNITEQFQQYSEIEKNNQNLKFYINNLPNTVIHFNNDFQVIYHNELIKVLENYSIDDIYNLLISPNISKINSKLQKENTFRKEILINNDLTNRNLTNSNLTDSNFIENNANSNIDKQIDNVHFLEIIVSKYKLSNTENGYLLVINDISNFVKIKNAHSTMQEKMIGIYNATTNYHLIFDTNCKVLWFNRKAFDNFSGFSNKKLEYGVSFYEYFDNLDSSRFVENFEIALSGMIVNYKTNFKFPLIDRNIWLDVTYLPVFIDNKLFCISLKLIDITEKVIKDEEISKLNKELEEKITYRTIELEKLNNEKDEILSLAAHDLKNPLSTILLQTSIIKKYFQNNQIEKVGDKLTEIEANVSRMSELITNLLEINRLESGKFNLYPNLVNITELIIDEINRYESYYNSKNIIILSELEEDVLTIVDPYVFTQIFDNIFSNAIKYSPLNSKIIITLNIKNDTNIYFSIQDFGTGISKAEMKLLFKKFTRLSSVPTAGENSTGLGLSIVKKYLDLINGEIICKSDIGLGTEFIVKLPLILES